MESLIVQYGVPIVALILVAVQYKIFMTPADFQKERADLIKYIADNYVSDKTYRENHRNLQEQLSLIHQDINDVKNLLIQRKGEV